MDDIYIWSHLRLSEVEFARERALETKTVEVFKRFCQELRSAKLRYWREDRQMPGKMDGGARLLVQWAELVMDEIPAEVSSRSMQLVRGGIGGHLDELIDHLAKPIEERPVIVDSFESVPLTLGLGAAQ